MILGQRAHLELHIDYEEYLPESYEEIAELLDKWGLSKSPQEVGWALAIDPARRIKTFVEVSRGTAQGMDIHIPTVLQAVLMSGSDRWAYVHNHPSGDPTPSAADIDLMEILREASDYCGLYLEDGIIVTGDPRRWASMMIDGCYRPKKYPGVVDAA